MNHPEDYPPNIKSEHEDVSIAKFDIDTNLATLQIKRGDYDHWGVRTPCPGCFSPLEHHPKERDYYERESSYLVTQRPQRRHIEPSYWSTENDDDDVQWPNRDEEEPGFPDRLEGYYGLNVPGYEDISDEESDDSCSNNSNAVTSTIADTTRIQCGRRRRRMRRGMQPARFVPYEGGYAVLSNLSGRDAEQAIAESFASLIPMQERSNSPSSEISLQESSLDGSSRSSSEDFISAPPSPSAMGVDLPAADLSYDVLDSLQLSERNIPVSAVRDESLVYQTPPTASESEAQVSVIADDSAHSTVIPTPLDLLPEATVRSVTEDGRLASERTGYQRMSETGATRQISLLKEKRAIIMSSPRNIGASRDIYLESEADELEDIATSRVAQPKSASGRRKRPAASRRHDSEDGSDLLVDAPSSSTGRTGKSPGSKRSSSSKEGQPQDRKFKCSLCPMMFTRRNDVKRHMKNALIHKGAIPVAANSEIRCKQCGEELSRADARRRHEAKNACGKRTNPRSAASRYLRTVGVLPAPLAAAVYIEGGHP